MISSTKNKINSKEAKLCVIGLGYVGLPLAIAFSKKFNVIGFDISAVSYTHLTLPTIYSV